MKKTSLKKSTKKEEPKPWRVVKRKSRAGIEYTTYLPPLIQFVQGFNHHARKVLDAMERRLPYRLKLKKLQDKLDADKKTHRDTIKSKIGVKKVKKPSTWVSKRSQKKNAK